MSLKEISKKALAHPIAGVNLRSSRFDRELDDSRLFLVFLRHLG